MSNFEVKFQFKIPKFLHSPGNWTFLVPCIAYGKPLATEGSIFYWAVVPSYLKLRKKFHELLTSTPRYSN